MPVETTSIERGVMSGYAFSQLSLPDYVISAGPRVNLRVVTSAVAVLQLEL